MGEAVQARRVCVAHCTRAGFVAGSPSADLPATVTTSLPLITRAIDIRKMPVSEAKRGYPVRLKAAIDQAGRHRKRNRIAR